MLCISKIPQEVELINTIIDENVKFKVNIVNARMYEPIVKINPV